MEEKIGLALSGGGFRAAFFHVGVLARLAETGILPRVEMISTVSGGSIVGATYYVCLKRKLEKTSGNLGRRGYADLVVEVEELLRRAVRKNIRTRVFANPLKNAQMALSSRYSRSDRIGDLYDRYLYKPALGKRKRKWRGLGPERQIELQELLIEPGGNEFDPRCDNRGREEKVPILMINATSLNTGHNWRFEATCMGESLPEDERGAAIVKEVDKNMLLERGYFRPRQGQHGIPEQQTDFPLGLAVAASACVPGAFQPLAISDMYDGIRVQLVDGGVQDNQGVQGLLDWSCRQLIVSDASGQMDDDPDPSARIPGVVGRTLSIEGDRIRDGQLVEALQDECPCALMHLRKGLVADSIPPSTSIADQELEVQETPYTSDAFDVAPPVQRALSLIRTDLDFFGDEEASALELDGYEMAGFELEGAGLTTPDEIETPPTASWVFLDPALRVAVRDGYGHVLRRLEAGRHRFLRTLRPHRPVGVALVILALAALAGIVYLGRDALAELAEQRWPAWAVLLVLIVAAAVAAEYALDPRSKKVRGVLRRLRFLFALPLAVLGAVAAPAVFTWVVATDAARSLLRFLR